MTKEQRAKILAIGCIPLEIEGKVIALRPKEESLKKLAEVYKLGIGIDKKNNYYLLGLARNYGAYMKPYYKISSDFSNCCKADDWKYTSVLMIRLNLPNWDIGDDIDCLFHQCINLESVDNVDYTINRTDLNTIKVR